MNWMVPFPAWKRAMSSSDPFSILGIERKGAEERDVKRAYAKKLKVTRPEDDPQGFMELRVAMEAAIRQIRWSQYDDLDDESHDDQAEPAGEEQVPTSPAAPTVMLVDPFDVTVITEAGDEDSLNSEEASTGPFSEGFPEQTHENEGASVDRAIGSVRALMAATDQNTDWQNWLDIIEDERIEGIDAFLSFSDQLRYLVCQETGFRTDSAMITLTDRLPPSVILKLDDRFGWSQQSGTEWHERDQNIWTGRVVDACEDIVHKNQDTPWGKQKPRIEVIGRGAQVEKKLGENTSAALSLLWIIVRIAMLFGLIRFVGQLFDR